MALKTNSELDNCDINVWESALKKGPVLAQGKYGWSRMGIGNHVVLLAGVSNTKNLAFYNPNIMAVLPHPIYKNSYFTLDRCKELAFEDNPNGGPFWQCSKDT
jgi:hypothetical protein